jgi:hypothetical protein
LTFRVNLLPQLGKLPLLLFKFWFFEGPQFILSTTWLLVRATGNIFSLPILLRTYFAPWKGEYRKGYVGIARGVGIVVRTFTILVALAFVSLVLAGGLLLALAWIGLPILWTMLFLQTWGVIKFG